MELSRLEGEHSVKITDEIVRVEPPGTPEGEENLGIELAAELRKAVRYADYFHEIPEAQHDFTESANRSIDLSWGDLTPMFDARNTENLWLEIANTLANIRFQLAQSRAYKALEPPPNPADRRSEQLRYYAHFAKMNHLDLAVFGLAKIQDLTVRLLFENFGGDKFIPVDQSDPDWEKKLTLKEARKGLKARLDSGELPQSDYDQIVGALDEPSKSSHQATVVLYRNRLAHRIRASVDYSELFTELEDRVGMAIFDSAGKEKGRQFAIKARPSKPDFAFMDLYSALLDYLKHVIEMLTRLKRMPRFA